MLGHKRKPKPKARSATYKFKRPQRMEKQQSLSQLSHPLINQKIADRAKIGADLSQKQKEFKEYSAQVVKVLKDMSMPSIVSLYDMKRSSLVVVKFDRK